MGLKIRNLEINIGDKVFAVHKKYADENLGGKILVCRVKTFENKEGKVVPVLKEVGNVKMTITFEQYYIYYDINDAIDAITIV